jgi:8-oxo-dGTP pyrophosphatase MutT (NUDIX family)
MTAMKILFEFSAGGIVEKDGEILLILKKDISGKPRWTLPKGKIERNERVSEAAQREVLEETGCSVIAQGLCAETSYPYIGRDGILFIKRVYWYRMSFISSGRERDEEAEAVEWVDRKTAPSRLFYGNDKYVLQRCS